MIAAEDLVRLALAKLDLDERDAAKLAEQLGLTKYSSPQRVRRWIAGENEPDYELTIKLLDLVGAIKWEALGPRAAREAEAVRKGREAADRARAATDRGQPRRRRGAA